jgi:hypothetical protein
MNDDSTYELEDLVVQPGTYFNPQTEVVVVVDDTASIDQEVFTADTFAGAEWVRVAEEPAVDEQRRDELIDEFQNDHHEGRGSAVGDAPPEPDDFDPHDLDDEEEDEPGL